MKKKKLYKLLTLLLEYRKTVDDTNTVVLESIDKLNIWISEIDLHGWKDKDRDE